MVPVEDNIESDENEPCVSDIPFVNQVNPFDNVILPCNDIFAPSPKSSMTCKPMESSKHLSRSSIRLKLEQEILEEQLAIEIKELEIRQKKLAL